MALAVVYTTVHGMILHENRGGVETFFAPDPLGSLVQCRDTSGTVTYEATYWPYGEVRSETGTNPSPWGFVGLLGYLRDSASHCYVRARYYLMQLGQWLTVDPLWPLETPFSYGNCAPTLQRDVSGLAAVLVLPAAGLLIGLLQALLIALGIALALIILLLLLWEIPALRSKVCRKMYKRLKDVCGDKDGRPSDTSEGKCCGEDSCQALFYKGLAFQRCGKLRAMYSALCYGDDDENHLEKMREAGRQMGKCFAIFAAKCGPSLTELGRGLRRLII